MASAKFEGGKLHSSQEVKAQFRHSEKEERMKHEHSNKQIDLSLTVNNYSMENLSYQEMCDRYDNRIKELEPTTTNKRKDRVTCQCIEIPVPKDLPEEREEEWFRDTWSLLKDFYGEKNAIDGKVHADEKQPYMDNEGNWQIPRTHMHTYFVPEVNDSLNGKEFSKRTNIRKVNKMIHEMTMDKYGVMFMDGTKNKSTKTVEELKNDSRYRESVDILISQYEDMQAEKADLQADYDAKEAELIAEAQFRHSEKEERMGKNIKYQLWLDGFLDELDRVVCFLFCIPCIYETYEDAENACSHFYVKPRKMESGEVVFDVYEKEADSASFVGKDTIIDTIHWYEYWKYSCQILKETGIKKTLADILPESSEKIGDFANCPCMTETDFEPYADKFEEMYDKYLDTKKHTFDKICSYAVQSTAYEVRPIIVE